MVQKERKHVFHVTEHGVDPYSEELQTGALQAVIDEAHRLGGGEIVLPKGRYHIGSLRLYSHMTLRLEAGAQLIGSRQCGDYTDFHVPTTMRYVRDPGYIRKWNLPPYYIYGMLCAFDAVDIAVIGGEGSIIDGQDCYDPHGEEGFRGPMGLIFCCCEDVRLEGYTVVNSANWAHQLDSCTRVELQRVTVRAGHDGLDLHHCTDIMVRGCTFETGDDCLAGYDVEHLLVEDTYFNTACNALRLGGLDMMFLRCTFEGPGKYPHRSEGTYAMHALFKYYALKVDPARHDGAAILLTCCKIRDVGKLIVYEQGNGSLLQDGRPLRDLCFRHVMLGGRIKMSKVRGNGAMCRIVLQDVMLDDNLQLDGDSLLETDADVQVENC